MKMSGSLLSGCVIKKSTKIMILLLSLLRFLCLEEDFLEPMDENCEKDSKSGRNLVTL